MKNLFLFFNLILILFCSCSENDHIIFVEKNGLTFYKDDVFAGDSLVFVYSFINEAVTGDNDIVWVPITLTGKPSETDLPFTLEVGKESTAKEGVHFLLSETIFPANTVTFNYPVTLLRTEDLKEEPKSFTLKIKENECFSVGALETYYRYSSVKFNITDQIIKPSWWGFVESLYYGSYSNEKYKFMVEVAGVSNFSTEEVNFVSISNYIELFKAAIIEYEKEHGYPLRDENGQVITF